MKCKGEIRREEKKEKKKKRKAFPRNYQHIIQTKGVKRREVGITPSPPLCPLGTHSGSIGKEEGNGSRKKKKKGGGRGGEINIHHQSLSIQKVECYNKYRDIFIDATTCGKEKRRGKRERNSNCHTFE